MIPPSVPLVIYAILTQESIGKLFMAAVLPGHHRDARLHAGHPDHRALKPGIGPGGPGACAWAEKLRSLLQVFPVLLVFVVVIVGIYGGWANPDRSRGDRRGGVRDPGRGRGRHARARA